MDHVSYIGAEWMRRPVTALPNLRKLVTVRTFDEGRRWCDACPEDGIRELMLVPQDGVVIDVCRGWGGGTRAGRVDYRVVGGSLDPEFLPLPTSGPLLPGIYKFT
jgi:hypothetical protein